MPARHETQYALSALPPALRDHTSVYLLDPRKGYQLSRQGTNGLTCLVERTVWELADFRNDIYIPLCYDAAGAKAHLKVIMDTAALRAQGMGPAALKAEIESRYRDKTYKVPEKPGLSYMLSPVMRTVGPRIPLEKISVVVAHGRDHEQATGEARVAIDQGRFAFIIADPGFSLEALATVLSGSGEEVEIAVCEDLGYPAERISFGPVENPPRPRSSLFCVLAGRFGDRER